ncbi:MAG: alcohol dehydrogenase catalytic domain-containing protein, partial [Alphaproteobacteria bacterium]
MRAVLSRKKLAFHGKSDYLHQIMWPADCGEVFHLYMRRSHATDVKEISMRYAMAAAKPGGSDVIRKIALGDIAPGAGEVLIRHEAIGINFLDIYIRNGLYPWPVETDHVLGSEGAGIIEAIGDGVTGFSIGDRVGYTLANGAYATHRVIDAGYVVKLPDNVSSELAASIMLKGLTVAYLIHDSFKVEAGHTVLFHAAAGGVGLIAGQWLN